MKPEIAREQAYFVGTRKAQTVLARLRFGHCRLAASQYRFNLLASPFCRCQLEHETVSHFLLECSYFDQQGVRLMAAESEVYNGPVTEEILLGTLGNGLKFEQRVEI